MILRVGSGKTVPVIRGRAAPQPRYSSKHEDYDPKVFRRGRRAVLHPHEHAEEGIPVRHAPADVEASARTGQQRKAIVVRVLCRVCAETYDRQRFDACPNCEAFQARKQSRTVIRPTLLSLFMGGMFVVLVLQGVVLIGFLMLRFPLGAIVVLLGHTVLTALLGRGLYRNRDWTREALLAWVLVPAIAPAFLTIFVHWGLSLTFILFPGGLGIASACFLAWYLFAKPNVVEYYRSLIKATEGPDTLA